MAHLRRLPRSLLLWAALWPASAAAARLPDETDHALPCRPTIACTADLVPPGVVELEAGYLLRRLQAGVYQHSTPWLLKLTLAAWAQLQLGGNGGTFTSGGPADGSDPNIPARYLDDVTLGLKLHLRDQGAEAPSLSFSGEVSVPTFANQMGYLRTYDLLFTLYVTKDFGWLHADLNAGLNLWRVESAPLVQGLVALAFSVELPRRFGLMAECYGSSDAAPVAPADAGVLVAVSYSPRPWLTLDLGGDAGLVQATRAFSVFVGFTIIAGDLWDTAPEIRKRAEASRR